MANIVTSYRNTTIVNLSHRNELKVVHLASTEQMTHLLKQLNEWNQNLEKMRDKGGDLSVVAADEISILDAQDVVFGIIQSMTNEQVPTSPVEKPDNFELYNFIVDAIQSVVGSSEKLVEKTDPLTLKKDNDLHYISVEDSSGKIQGCSVYNLHFDRLDYLMTAPTNLSIAANSDSPKIRGAGTALLEEGMRQCLLHRSSGITTFPTALARPFYVQHKFTPLDKESNRGPLHIFAEQIKQLIH